MTEKGRVAALLLGLGATGPAAASFPSGKATVNVADVTLIEKTDWRGLGDG